ncbi:GDSL-type esterase/lipase family protein [Dehalobacter restrictus]|uniref:GDSL family lipase n=1 Tax=Dehalobacter restrictus TaxID=55583 RepID=A0A857DM49_9FIRM|nr:GDSL-type esterase/lipase family protein [Dehalobacter restrictus]QHA01522.1 GDSL family lipase [Dehalobacter restrictus]
MRTYRLEIRVIQLSVLMAVVVLVFGFVNVWNGGTPEQSASGSSTVQSGGASNGGGTENGAGDSNGDTVLNGSGTTVNTKMVCLGDSFTYGYPGEPSSSWPQHLADVLKVEVVNAGQTYQNASSLLERFEEDVIAEKPGTVIIFAGVGDAIRGTPLEEYQNNIKAMVEKATANQIKPVLVLPIPFPDTDELYKQYREWETAYAQEQKITTLDFKGVLFGDGEEILRKYSDDGRYPNKDGYQAMGDYAATVLQ